MLDCLWCIGRGNWTVWLLFPIFKFALHLLAVDSLDMLSPDTLHHQEEVNSALDRQIRQDIQDMAQEAQIQAQIIAHEGRLFVVFLCEMTSPT